jgi:hypothetical protein
MEAALNSSLGRTVLGQTSLKIGRAPDNTLVITDPQSSAHHAELAPGLSANSYQVTDLGSTNGTFVNEQRLAPNTPRALNANDVIRIGTTQFTYEVTGAGYAPTVAASAPSYEPTVAAAPPSITPPPQPAYQPPVAAAPPAYQPPAQPAYTPPPGYPQPQPAYTPPQAQPAYAPPQAAYAQAQPVYPQPQPGYGAPGGFSQPGYPPKKGHAGLWITLVVILLVVIVGGGAIVYVTAIRSTPQKTLSAYCDGLMKSDAQKVYDQLDTAQQAKTSVKDFQDAFKVLNSPLIGGVKSCTVGNVTESGSTATATVTLTFGVGKSSSETDTLIQENGTWKLDSSKSNDDTGL